MDNYETLVGIANILYKHATDESDPFLVITADRDGEGSCIYSGNSADELVFLWEHLKKVCLGMKEKDNYSRYITHMRISKLLQGVLDEVYKR